MEGPPNHPKTFGEELQRLRESAGLSLEDIVAETKISRQILSGLEAGDYRFLPQKVFCRNFVAQYAKFVGADPQRLVDGFEAAWERFLLASGSYPSVVFEDAPLVRTVRWRFWGPVLAAAAIMFIAAIVIWRSSLQQGQFDGGNRTAVSADRSVSRSTPTLLVETRPSPSPIENGAANPQRPEMVSIVIRVRPESECWIHYRDNNGAAGGKLLAGGTEERIELLGPIKLTVGDAGAASLEVAGRVYDDLGRAGQVVHTEVSREGLVVLGPKAHNG